MTGKPKIGPPVMEKVWADVVQGKVRREVREVWSPRTDIGRVNNTVAATLWQNIWVSIARPILNEKPTEGGDRYA